MIMKNQCIYYYYHRQDTLYMMWAYQNLIVVIGLYMYMSIIYNDLAGRTCCSRKSFRIGKLPCRRKKTKVKSCIFI